VDELITGEQRLLLDVTRRFVAEAYPLSHVRANAITDPSLERDYRQRAAELGWFSMLVPENQGGGSVSGNGVVDAALVASARGQGLQPLAFVDANVAAHAISAAGSEEQRATTLSGLLSGELAISWVLGAPGVHGARWSIRSNTSGSRITLDGAAPFVQDADRADVLLVTATDERGCSQFLVPRDTPGITTLERASLDLSRRFAEVRFEGVEIDASTRLRNDEHDTFVDRQVAIAGVLTAAESIGAMQADFDLALQYAKDRIAFGRPIGSFQAVKHLLADTSMFLEASIAVTLAAAEELGAGDDYGVEAASIAKSFVGDAAVELAQNCFQVFGGIAFTWEHDQHLYLRRLTTDAALYGDGSWQRERLCRLAGLPAGTK
jgi:alkylation response protein AidB-like acyl-CoA dehydrogenase